MITRYMQFPPGGFPVLLLSILFLALAVTGAGAQSSTGFVRTQGPWLMDGHGRVLMLHGVNLGSKTPPFLPWATRDEVMVLREWGFNSVRYYITWEAVEPQPGEYDDAFLDKLAERLDWCREAGLRVILDMHQDLYARDYLGGDGAPAWARLDDGLAHEAPEGAWFTGYWSPAVQRAFDNFWANKPGPGGVGIQDRFAAMWQHVARRFRDDTNIMGYDILNEPSYGEDLNGVMAAIATGAVKELGPEAAAAVANLDFAAISQMIQALLKKDAAVRVLDYASPLNQKAEQAKLQPFYDRVTAAIRAVDPHHVIFFDPAFGDLSGTRLLTGLEAPKDAAGRPFANVVFAPHSYDFSTDYLFPYVREEAGLRESLGRAKSAGDRMGVPTWFGEWGTWPPQSERPDGRLLTVDHMDACDEMLCGWAYWAYWGPTFKDFSLLPLLTRPYPEVIAGIPQRIWSTDDGVEVRFAPLPQGGETVIWASPSYHAEVNVRFDGEGAARRRRDSDGRIRVTCSAGADACTIAVSLLRAGQAVQRRSRM
ncbi:MAG: cellulase family glycosylhydrolase [Armatimonadota bacterium]|nr:MAG: cellulase family glycosylhydrolase [Armatimonadota bacterium]